MDKKIKRIDIVFENCEIAILSPNMIESLYIRNVNKDIILYNANTIQEIINCSFISFRIGKEGFDIKTNFGMSLLKRLKRWKDITHIDIMYDDGTNDYIGVPWDNSSEFTNSKQKNYITELFIEIEIE